jgi:DNA polymerase elongation subunit (family B)
MYVDENNDEDILFQILEWDSSHEDDEDGQLKFIVRLFGKTKDNKNIYIQTSDFEPYFFVELDKKWTESTIHMMLKKIKSMVKPELVKGLKKTKIISKHKFYGFTNYEKFNFLQLIFSDNVSMKSYAYTIMNRPIYMPLVSKKAIKLKVYESNIEPLMRLMHIRNLDAVGWVKINKKKYKTHKGPLPPSVCEKNIECRWTELNRIDDRTIQKFDICAFDIECTSEDGSFPNPQRDGDKVIQIGLTFSKFGDDECYYKHILTLGETADVEGATVEWFETEEELLLGFTKIINKLNPDILTGYNIFGFDFKYLMNRANKLDIYPKFSRLSRIKGEISEFVSQILKSSALGKNELYYYKMVGRIVIDLMKVIQRDFKLPSYKLDDVASFFIREEIKNFDNSDKNYTKIITKSTNGVYVGDYIKIGYNDGITENKHMDGEKFQIIEMTKTSLLVKRQINFDEIWGKGYKVFWCQSKDDVKPRELFALQKGSAKDRAIIAKYCLMDCSLCNKLMGKLQILTNNIGMANVCHVPLSYLFLRGQGVKIFSLVSKKCREEEHLIPVIKKKKKNDKIVKDTERIEKYLNTNKNNDYEDDEDDNGYEGATVFPPEKGLHTDPVPVLDYASLYPNSMILRNLSHEMLIDDPKYDNIPGYRYHQIMFKNSNNTTSSCKFAERIDPTGLTQKKGIIPVILMELLTARKRVRAEAANTENKFLASILEGLQLAFKCTANSLYGQTGAPTSPIFMKEIAASTTATGREALQYSRYFIENIFYKMVEYALNDKKKYIEYSDKEYINYPNMIKTTMVFGDIFKNYKNIFIAMGFNIFGIEQKFKNTFENVSQENKFEFYNDIIRLFEENISYTEFCEKQQKYLLTLEFNHKYHQNNEEFEYELNIIKNKLMTEDQLEEFYDDLYFMFYTEFHIHTDKAYPIPEKIFNRKEIGYEFENNIYNIIENDLKLLNLDYNKLFEKLKELYPDDSKKLPTNIDPDNIKKFINSTFNNFIFGGINKMKVYERSACLNDICDCINGKLKIQAFYEKYSQLCNDIIIKLPELDNKKIISNIIKDMNNDTKNKLTLMITNIIKNFGYSGKSEMLEKFHEVVNDILTGYEIKPKVIYGDTDSVFFKPTITNIETGEILRDKKGLEISIILGQWASILITTLLPTPMSQEYEKVLWPFAILTKKRYVGNLYEKNPNKYYQKSMGIVLKRRDNAQIVKVVCGGIIDQMLNKNSPDGAVKLTQDCLRQIISGKFKLDKFVVTKTLKGPGLTKLEREKESKKNKEDRTYADRTRIVHAVLADRMADRDPGNKPLSNDRIPYVYFETKDEPELQGDRVENLDYLIENNLKIDYLFYITNQIMKPAIQFLELIVENPKDIFNNYIIREKNRKKGIIPIMSYFKETGVKNENLFENFFNEKEDIVNYKQIKKRSVLPKRKQSIIDKKTENKIEYKPFDDDYFDK